VALDAARFAADCGAVLLSAEMTGASGTLLARAVEYAKTREQFGKVIGAQQAIKHQLADVAAELELARAAVGAAVPLLRPDAHRSAAVATAKATASELFLKAADTGLHVHGGMGFTWEQDSHVFLRRARFASGVLGSVRHHREAYVLRQLGGGDRA
jgi:alkylation response protein AidB-like acyl-CoA dehydrogenase